ncbi:MAG: hypothetical protein EBS07_01710 [Sphingobacteriia bacterium]|nr:hypothetical protein [Sphingobacteriia bacterium]
MEKFKFDILGITSSHSNIGSFTLVLGEPDGRRRLPIVIGAVEAQAIMMEIENIKPHRPMTHDLLYTICDKFNVDLIEVNIVEMKEAVFFARMKFNKNGIEHEIDARPSDAIAVAVRFRVPIYVYEKVFRDSGIEIKENEDANFEETDNNPIMPEFQASPSSNVSKPDQITAIKQQMEEAIQNEDYELAAQLRDKLTQLEQN